METATQTTIGIAWRLYAPSDTGGKIYTIAVIGNDLVVAWGRRTAAGMSGAGSQAKVEPYPSHAAALAAAMERTIAKESRGYRMDLEPRRLNVSGRQPNGNTAGAILFHGVVI
jgi:predicted DNA-binding WGR domain protein